MAWNILLPLLGQAGMKILDHVLKNAEDRRKIKEENTKKNGGLTRKGRRELRKLREEVEESVKAEYPDLSTSMINFLTESAVVAVNNGLPRQELEDFIAGARNYVVLSVNAFKSDTPNTPEAEAALDFLTSLNPDELASEITE